MHPTRFTRIDQTTWQIEPTGALRVPGVISADEDLILNMDDKVYEQTANVATLPGIVKAVYVMPDAHWGYGFPIGGVAAFAAALGGVIFGGGGEPSDLRRIEEDAQMAGAEHACVSNRAKERQRREMGTLGSGNHYLEVQAVCEIFDEQAAMNFGLKQDEVVVTIHCGSR